jgi:uncharacterized protein
MNEYSNPVMFQESILLEALEALPKEHRVAFAASCCERLWPNYVAFWQLEKWGNPKLLKKALDQIWGHLAGEELTKEFLQLPQLLERIGPDTEDFANLFVAAAGDAVAATIYTLQCCSDGSAVRAATVGRLPVESIHQYLYIVNDPGLAAHDYGPTLDTLIQTSPLITEELRKQRDDLELLQSTSQLEPGLLTQLRVSSSSIGLQPFKRGLLPVSSDLG